MEKALQDLDKTSTGRFPDSGGSSAAAAAGAFPGKRSSRRSHIQHLADGGATVHLACMARGRALREEQLMFEGQLALAHAFPTPAAKRVHLAGVKKEEEKEQDGDDSKEEAKRAIDDETNDTMAVEPPPNPARTALAMRSAMSLGLADLRKIVVLRELAARDSPTGRYLDQVCESVNASVQMLLPTTFSSRLTVEKEIVQKFLFDICVRQFVSPNLVNEACHQLMPTSTIHPCHPVQDLCEVLLNRISHRLTMSDQQSTDDEFFERTFLIHGGVNAVRTHLSTHTLKRMRIFMQTSTPEAFTCGSEAYDAVFAALSAGLPSTPST